MKPIEIAIAGCGPAGLTAALALNAQGHRVTLFDQFAAPMPLGSGLILQPTGLAVLDWLGLGARMGSLGAPIDRLYGRACGSERVVLDVRYEALGSMRGLAVHRAGLFNVLYDAVKVAGIAVHTSSPVKDLQQSSLILHPKEKVGPFDLVIDALGAKSPLIPHAAAPEARARLDYGAIWASLPWPGPPFDPHALEQRYDAANVMIGVLPIGRRHETDSPMAAFFWSLRTEDFPRWRADGLNRWKHRVRRYWPETSRLLDTIERPEQMVLAAYEHHTLPLPFGERLVFIGDAAHSTSPQLGQGANMALLDVYALAHALETSDSVEQVGPAYARLRRRHVKLYQALSRVFTPFYQSDSAILPLIRDFLVAPVSTLPGAAKLLALVVAGLLGRPLMPLANGSSRR